MRAFVLLCLLQASFAQIQNGWNGPAPLVTEPVKFEPGFECMDRVESCTCCLILQDVNKLKTKLDAAMTKLEGKISLTAQSLSQLQASRAAFSVSLFTEDKFKCVGSFKSDKVLTYEHVFLNLGGHYDVTSGIFTVPQTGLYTIANTIYGDTGSRSAELVACIGLQVNGQVVAKCRENNYEDYQDSNTSVLVLQLNIGDTVAVKLFTGCVLCDESHYNTFSAFLLY